MARISLIIPTLNERGAIEPLLLALNGAVNPSDFEVVIVDDGSTDGTVAAARALSLPFPIKIIERRERGLATAVLRGFAEATGEIVGVMDADGSHPTEMIPRLVAVVKNADLAIGSRLVAGGAVEEWPWSRRIGSLFMSALARPLARGISDPLSGFFFIRRELLDATRFNPIGYKILLELIVKTRPQNIVEIPFTFKNRSVGQSKMGFLCLPETMNYLRLLGRLYRWRLFKN